MERRKAARLLCAALASGAVLHLPGCAAPTAYQRQDRGEGYLDYMTQPGVYFVSFTGNQWTNKETVERYWHRRAAEICGGPGRYEILGLDASGKAVLEPSPNVLWPATRPKVEGLIRCTPD